jgi:DNA-binding transcriptional LysR family regulator
MPSISTAYLQRGLTLRHLHLLTELDETRHVGKVAAALHVSQPAISKSLAEIETGLGVPLFERTPRGLVPTEHGARLVRFAYGVFNDIARLGDELSSVDQLPAAVVLAVGAMSSLGSTLLPAAIAKCRQRLPQVVATLSEGPMFSLLRQLQAGKLDVVVGALIDQVPAELTQRPLYADPVVAVCAGSSPLADLHEPAWETLLAQPWVLPPHPSGARKAIEALWGRLGHSSPPVIAEMVSPEMTVELLSLEPAIGILPKRLARRYADGGRLAILDVELTGLVLPIGVFTLARAAPAARIEVFVQSLVESASPT